MFDEIGGLSTEIREKLNHNRPASLGAAARIQGMTPAALASIAAYCRKRRRHSGQVDSPSSTSVRVPSAAGATPAMAQWFAAKADHPDALLFFRMGDFYELFFADAEAAAAALDIALSHRGEHAGTPIPMCGVPHHASESYLARLIRRGFRVAIVEQMEDPKARTGKLPIKREVVRIITPGTITEDALLEAGRPNLLMALAWDNDDLGAAWIDVSTGLFETAAIEKSELTALLGRLEPVEILAPQSLDLERLGANPFPRANTVKRADRAKSSGGGVWSGQPGCVRHVQRRRSDRRCNGGGLYPKHAVRRPAPARPPDTQGKAGALLMDAATRASLEILRSRDGSTQHTLFSCHSSYSYTGRRTETGYLVIGTADRSEAIAARQDAWSWCVANRNATVRLRAILRTAPDMARALGRLSLNRGAPKDLAAVRHGLRHRSPRRGPSRAAPEGTGRCEICHSVRFRFAGGTDARAS